MKLTEHIVGSSFFTVIIGFLISLIGVVSLINFSIIIFGSGILISGVLILNCILLLISSNNAGDFKTGNDLYVLILNRILWIPGFIFDEIKTK